MSIDLETQIRAYAELIEASLPVRDDGPAAQRMLRERSLLPVEDLAAGTPWLSRRSVRFATAAAAILLALVGVSVMTGSDAEDDLATAGLDTTTLTVEWRETDSYEWGIETVAGTLRVDSSGRLLRLVDRTTWSEIAHFIDVTVDPSGVAAVEASGTQPGSVLVFGTLDAAEDDPFGLRREPVLRQSFDGVTWSDIDISELLQSHQEPPGCSPGCRAAFYGISAAFSDGVTIFGSPGSDQVVGVVDSGRVTDVHEAPWDGEVTGPLHYLQLEGEVVVHQGLFFSGEAVAWRHLGGDAWTPPVSVPYAHTIATRDNVAFMFERPVRRTFDPPFALQRPQRLLMSTDGIEWQLHATLESETNLGLDINAGDSFWVYGPTGFEGSGIERYREFDTIWISSDAEVWTSVDLSFAAEHSGVTVAGDEIVVVPTGRLPGSTWVGHVRAVGDPQETVEDSDLLRVGDEASSNQWTRVPHDAAAFSSSVGPPAMRSVVRGGPGLVAVGHANYQWRPAVWTSADGVAWTRIPDADVDLDRGVMAAVTTGGPGLVAAGGGEGLTSAVWTSSDGLEWSRVPFDEAVFGASRISSVVAGGPGLVAVGTAIEHVGPVQSFNAAVWTSPDGLTWSRVPHDDELFGTASMASVAASPSGMVAVGWDEDANGRGVGAAAVWLSADGLEWSRVPHEPTVFGTETATGHSPRMTGVTVGGPGLVAVGWSYDSKVLHIPVVWTSADGTTWSRVPRDEAVFGRDGWFDTVTSGDGGLVAVGNLGCSPAVWASQDGVEWALTSFFEDTGCVASAPEDPIPFGVSPGGPGFVVVGNDGAGAAVWTTTR